MIIKRSNKDQIPALKSLWKQAFGDSDEFIDAFFTTAFSDTRCRCAVDKGELVAALYWFDCEYLGKKVAYLYAIATAKGHQGKGVCTALMNETHKALRGLGYEGAILVPGSSLLFEFYKRFGYNEVLYISEFTATAGEKVTLDKISAREYQRLRQEYLPEGGVAQQGENTLFLAEQAEFYGGDDFILAAKELDGEFFGTELLGNYEKAGGILAALGYCEAVFRTVGKGKPFALWLPLGSTSLPRPEYFGLAFD